ncbi:MAG: hypothetical protein FWB93_05695 [Oscillospiraceae bacterium]|nr:hypothetical protein [Oscillospiraceae bacterium]
MSNREKCLEIINSFSDEQLSHVANLLQALIEEAIDDAFCQKLYEDYLNDPDPEKDKSEDIHSLASRWGITLE